MDLNDLNYVASVIEDALTMQADPDEMVRAMEIINEAIAEMSDGNESGSAGDSVQADDAEQTPVEADSAPVESE